MAKDIGGIVNEGLRTIGEPEITALTSDNILELTLIEEANIAIRDILGRHRFEWGNKRTTLTTTDDISTESVAVTNGSTTVTSVTAAGASAANFGSVTTSMWFRRTSDQTSYEISSINTALTPHTMVLANAYIGVTATATGYRCFQDTYSVPASDLDVIQTLTYGEAATTWYASGNYADREVAKRNFSDLIQLSGGDLHRNTTGRPAYYALGSESIDSDDNPQIILWPFPTDDYLMSLWYSIAYSENSTFDTSLFSADAPALAYDVVGHRVKARAYKWDKMSHEYAEQMRLYEQGIGNLIRRENDYKRDQSMKVHTYRMSARRRLPVRSMYSFDTKSAAR
jgi:hypothetical protein